MHFRRVLVAEEALLVVVVTIYIYIYIYIYHWRRKRVGGRGGGAPHF